jgi:YopX protein.
MRDIKFRAWDGADMIWFDLSLCNRESMEWFDNTIWRNPVMQFTGLKDLYGAEIYESDIVHTITQDGEEWGLAEVTYTDCCFMLTFASNAQYNLCEFGELSVKGNIYQNPELLNPDNQ